MKVFVSVSVTAVLAAMAMPAFAQSGKDAVADRTPPKTYKRKLYDGKDAEKYRSMKDVQYFEGNRKNRPKGGHQDQDKEAGTPTEERQYAQKQYRDNGREATATTTRNEEENVDRAERREARPVSREEENAPKAEEGRERDGRTTEAVKEEGHEHEQANESRRSYRREMRGSRKDMRRKSREEKWTRSGDGR